MSTLDDNWGSMPTPTEAATLLRRHAREYGLPPGDNNFDDAANVIERLQSALEAREWQPIETAPKDGSALILGFQFAPYGAVAAPEAPALVHRLLRGQINVGRWVGKLAGWFALDDDVSAARPLQPTLWQPLPTPPAAAIRKLQEQS